MLFLSFNQKINIILTLDFLRVIIIIIINLSYILYTKKFLYQKNILYYDHFTFHEYIYIYFYYLMNILQNHMKDKTINLYLNYLLFYVIINKN